MMLPKIENLMMEIFSDFSPRWLCCGLQTQFAGCPGAAASEGYRCGPGTAKQCLAPRDKTHLSCAPRPLPPVSTRPPAHIPLAVLHERPLKLVWSWPPDLYAKTQGSPQEPHTREASRRTLARDHGKLDLPLHSQTTDLLLARTRCVSSASQAGLLKPRGAAGARADEKEVTAVYYRPFGDPGQGTDSLDSSNS